MKLLRGPQGFRVVPKQTVDLLEQCKAQAAQRIEHAQREGELRAAEEKMRALQAAKAEASALLIAAEAVRRTREAQTESDVAELALEIARNILGQESATGTTVVRAIARKALLRLRRARNIVLRMHPQARDELQGKLHELLPAGMEPTLFEVEGDPALSLGDVVVESELGSLDARLEQQLQAVHRALKGVSA